MIYDAIDALTRYAVDAGLMPAEETVYARNLLLDAMHEDDFPSCEGSPRPLPQILRELTDIAVARGIIPDTVQNRDLFDTRLMNCLTPRPAQVQHDFRQAYGNCPKAATDYFYRLCQDSNYIRRDRIARDKRWVYDGAFGSLDITINKSKPEKDPRDIAAAGKVSATGYPQMPAVRRERGLCRSHRPSRPGQSPHHPPDPGR